MLWEELTSEELKKAAQSGLIPILPVGSLEKHGPHLPLGTDTISIFNICRLAAEREPAIVLPPLYYAYVSENRHFAGAISLSAETLIKMLWEICNEVSRNGFKKILVVNGHGGNTILLSTFLKETQFSKDTDYVIYTLIGMGLSREERQKILEGKPDGHGGVVETSLILHFNPDLVKLEKVRGEAKTGSLGLPSNIRTPLWWPALAIELYQGNPLNASREKGEYVKDKIANRIADALKAIKKDENSPILLKKWQEKAY